MFLPLCPIVVRLILGFSADSLVTYWGVAHVCVRTECWGESDSLLNHGAKIVQSEWNVKEKLVFFSFPRCRLSWTPVQRYEEKQSVVPLFPRLVTTFPTACYISLCISWLQSQILKYKSWWLSYIAEYKEDRWSAILLLVWNCGRIMGWMLGAVKKRAENGIFSETQKMAITNNR